MHAAAFSENTCETEAYKPHKHPQPLWLEHAPWTMNRRSGIYSVFLVLRYSTPVGLHALVSCHCWLGVHQSGGSLTTCPGSQVPGGAGCWEGHSCVLPYWRRRTETPPSTRCCCFPARCKVFAKSDILASVPLKGICHGSVWGGWAPPNSLMPIKHNQQRQCFQSTFLFYWIHG